MRRGVRVCTLAFRNAHGQFPRGVAIWVFYFSDAPQEPWVPRVLRRHSESGVRHIVPMTYLAAKDYACAEAHKRRVTSARIDPYPL